MRALPALLALAGLLSLPAPSGAQSPAPAKPAAAAPASPAGVASKPAAKPAPTVQPKPGTPKRPPAKPLAKPLAKPASKAAPAAAGAAAAAAAAAAAPKEPEKPAEPTKGSNTGAPLPRFATLRSDEVNFRAGPGTRYPIEWVYKRRDLPVVIEREFEIWRLVRDQEGVKGWVHQATLAPRRTGIVVATPGRDPTLRADARDDATPVARLRPGVIVRLRSCEATNDWCQAQVQDYRGWVRRADIWGTFPNEAIQ